MADPAVRTGEDIVDEDWYGNELTGMRFVDCRFSRVDLTEIRSRNVVFDGCRFGNCAFNASEHRESSFIACTFARSSFFSATLSGCKMSGSVFTDCDFHPITVEGGLWQGVTLRGADRPRSTSVAWTSGTRTSPSPISVAQSCGPVI
jgi:uncharacterized protein YjbI with pentapeptide repeats